MKHQPCWSSWCKFLLLLSCYCPLELLCFTDMSTDRSVFIYVHRMDSHRPVSPRTATSIQFSVLNIGCGWCMSANGHLASEHTIPPTCLVKDMKEFLRLFRFTICGILLEILLSMCVCLRLNYGIAFDM